MQKLEIMELYFYLFHKDLFLNNNRRSDLKKNIGVSKIVKLWILKAFYRDLNILYIDCISISFFVDFIASLWTVEKTCI